MPDHWDSDQVLARQQQLERILGTGVPTEQLGNDAHQRQNEAARRKRRNRPPKPGPPKSPFKLTY